ncbi:MAG TPA: hypothetical protein VFI31_08190 [Pirellulales bacterium]|nr:hypothetical protein [Pirellulales bacterium]
MPYPHSIRLRGPWQFEPQCRYLAGADGQVAESNEDLPAAGRATVPSDWRDALGADFRGRVRYRRSFNPPATLDPHERLWLVVEGVDAYGAVVLNGVRLGEVEGYAIHRSFDLTRLLGPRNEVTLEVELPGGAVAGRRTLRPGREHLPGGPIGEVRLEVRSQWFIEGLSVWSATLPEPSFVATGRIGGEPASTTLAVVISGCQREMVYVEVGSGEDFEVAFNAGDFPVWTADRPALAPMEIKLIAGSSAVFQTQIETGYCPAITGASRFLDEILPASTYAELDRSGTTIVQRVPPAWSSEVCRRLAPHPTIVAWSAGPGETPPSDTLCGRAWVSKAMSDAQ